MLSNRRRASRVGVEVIRALRVAGIFARVRVGSSRSSCGGVRLRGASHVVHLRVGGGAGSLSRRLRSAIHTLRAGVSIAPLCSLGLRFVGSSSLAACSRTRTLRFGPRCSHSGASFCRRCDRCICLCSCGRSAPLGCRALPRRAPPARPGAAPAAFYRNNVAGSSYQQSVLRTTLQSFF